MVYFFDVNKSVFLYLNSFSTLTGGFIWANLTLLADALVAVVLLFPFIRKKPELVWSALVAFGLAALLVHSIKPVLGISRPPGVLAQNSFNIIGPAHERNSFPSGHSATIFTLTGIFLFFIKSRIKYIGLFAALIIGLSRIMVGVHWPLDVCMGAVIGCFSAIGGYHFIAKINRISHLKWQLFIGGALLIAAITLLIDYHPGYDQAIWLQRTIAVAALVLGGREYIKLIPDNFKETANG